MTGRPGLYRWQGARAPFAGDHQQQRREGGLEQENRVLDRLVYPAPEFEKRIDTGEDDPRCGDDEGGGDRVPPEHPQHRADQQCGRDETQQQVLQHEDQAPDRGSCACSAPRIDQFEEGNVAAEVQPGEHGERSDLGERSLSLASCVNDRPGHQPHQQQHQPPGTGDQDGRHEGVECGHDDERDGRNQRGAGQRPLLAVAWHWGCRDVCCGRRGLGPRHVHIAIPLSLVSQQMLRAGELTR